MGFLELAKKRYSVRKFSDRAVASGTLRKILEVGNIAPTTKNLQSHIMLQAEEIGLSTCWCNYFSNSKLEKLFELPANEKSVLIMPLGYADDEVKPSLLMKCVRS